MADSTTTKLGAVKPEVGASGDTWGTKQNAAFDIFDAAISGTPATVASAATTDLSATTVPTINISGSVGITSFGNAVSGMIRKLIFGGAPLITNSVNIITLSGADEQMAAGYTAEVISLGAGAWKIFSLAKGAVASPIPIGSVMDYAGASAPSGWLLCFGQTISRTTYSALFAIVGTIYGVGDGVSTFNLPDFRGRVAAGQDDMGGTSANRLTVAGSNLDGDVLGGSGGAETVVLSVANLAAHTHTGPLHTHSWSDSATTSNANVNHSHGVPKQGSAAPAGGTTDIWMTTGAGTASTDPSGQLHTHTVNVGGTTGSGGNGATGSAGTGTGHSNVQPTLIINKMIFTSV